MKYVVCYSGGESSGKVAVMAVKRYGKENVILLNHNLSPEVEHEDIKRFKQELADKLGIEITYANMDNWETETPLRVCKRLGGWKFGTSPVLCTYNLKTKPFYKWLAENYPVIKGEINKEVTLLYGFDKSETNRIQRRIGILGVQGYKTDYPLALWENPIKNIEEFGVNKPITYKLFRHANCIGCLKAGKQSWYLVYCLYPKLWKEAVETEEGIGYSLLKDTFLKELEPKFAKMKCRGIVPSEEMKSGKFWSEVNKALPMDGQISFLPCECSY